MTARIWTQPSPESVAAYKQAVTSAPTSLLPGLSGIESVAAMAYMHTLPMSRTRSVVDTWNALPESVRDEWVTRAGREWA